MRSVTYAMTTLAMFALLCGLENAHAQVRAKAEVNCRPAEKLQYDCVIKLANSGTSEPLSRPHTDGVSGHALDAGRA